MENVGLYTGILTSDADPTSLGLDLDLNFSFTQETQFSGNNVSSEHETNPMESQAAEVVNVSGNHGKKGASHRQKKFDIEEDKVICSAWLQVSKDPIVGANQPHSTFWGRIHAFFEEHKDKKTATVERTKNSVMHRWGTIQKEVNKFCSCYEKIERRNASGCTIQDMINAALETYVGEDDENKQQKFTLMHCYHILKDEDKWKTLRIELNQKNKKQKTTKESTPSNVPSTNNDELQEVETPGSNERKRPPGQKQVKQARRDDASLAAFEKMLEKKEARDRERDKAREAEKEAAKEFLEVAKAALELEKKRMENEAKVAEANLVKEEAALELAKKRLSTEEKIAEANLIKEEKDIMLADTSKLDEDQLKWHNIMKKKILARYMAI